MHHFEAGACRHSNRSFAGTGPLADPPTAGPRYIKARMQDPFPPCRVPRREDLRRSHRPGSRSSFPDSAIGCLIASCRATAHGLPPARTDLHSLAGAGPMQTICDRLPATSRSVQTEPTHPPVAQTSFLRSLNSKRPPTYRGPRRKGRRRSRPPRLRSSFPVRSLFPPHELNGSHLDQPVEHSRPAGVGAIGDAFIWPVRTMVAVPLSGNRHCTLHDDIRRRRPVSRAAPERRRFRDRPGPSIRGASQPRRVVRTPSHNAKVSALPRSCGLLRTAVLTMTSRRAGSTNMY